MEEQKTEVVQIKNPEPWDGSMLASERALVDTQVATAHQFPRSLSRCVENSLYIVTKNEDVAKSCGYALARGGKPIMGPSVHLAKIIAQQYGNLRVEAKVVDVTPTQVVSRATAWDLETNYAAAFEVRRSIMGKHGRFQEDMITVTGNAANSIAFRNAVFAVVPKAIIDEVYNAARSRMAGDVSDENKLSNRRRDALRFFDEQYGINESEVLKLCGKYTVNQIGKDELVLLQGIAQALRDGDTTIDELMYPIRESKSAKSGKLNDIAARAAAQRKAAEDVTPTEI